MSAFGPSNARQLLNKIRQVADIRYLLRFAESADAFASADDSGEMLTTALDPEDDGDKRR